MLYVFTSCALNFVPCAKLLAESVKTHMRDAHFVLVLTDDKPKGFRLEDEGFDEVLYIEDFADQFDNPRGWAFGHTIMELATAVKPFTAAKLMERDDCDAVMFFDPDCVLFGKMTEMRSALKKNSVVLTPHASLLHENSDWIFFEKNPLKVGGFNLGFFALQNNETGRAVASWWRYRLRDYCLIDPDQGLFTDQKWIDLLPNYIDDLKVMREPVYNIARWNTFQRKISKRVAKKSGAVTYLADGKPIQFVHFSGFYKIGPYVQGLYDKSSEPLIEDLSTLQELSLWYSEKLAEARSHPEYMDPWKLGLYANGEEIPESDRRRYKSRPGLQQRYRDPFSITSLDSFWLFCRKQEQVEAETKTAALMPTQKMITSSVQAHNTLLREQNMAFGQQFAQMNNNIAELREQLQASEERRAQLESELLMMLQQVTAEKIESVFGWMQTEALFNAEEYLKQNPDVGDSGQTPLEHYIRFGLRENRTGSGLEPNWFLQKHSADLISLLQPEKEEPRPANLKQILFGNR